MKTIKERAVEYANTTFESGVNSPFKDFVAGAKSEHEELTRWHDPKTEHPYLDSTVLIKYEATSDSTVVLYQTTRYLVMPFVGPRFEFETDSRIKSGLFKIVGWRYIHEND